ncbi:MAG: replicative DNA helicase [Gemmatimonadota bacterium]|nr:replicative DNA helicase [Gemmatimonadota bacterium]MDH5283570.1 replicative DNA helicase [Gemmatimonadota bacterium]
MTSVSHDSSSTPDTASIRGAPWSNEAEQAVLGAMLLDNDAALRGLELLDDPLFYRESHRRVFRAMRRLVERRVNIDHVTLRDELERRGELDGIGGEVYLAELIDAAVTTANLEAHAGIVREKSVLRQLIEGATAIVSHAYEGARPASELLDEAESRIFQISQYRKAEGFSRIKEMLWPTMERIEKLHQQGKQVTGVPSGFKDLDDLTTGFQPNDLIILAARPSMGKTAFCLNIAAHAAATGTGVAFFSLEMAKESLVQRLLCAEARVDSQRVRRGTLSDTDFTMLARAAGVLANCPIWIDDTPALTLLEMRSKARRLRMENEVGLVVVDYLQLMRSPAYAENRVQEISDISRSLKALARELEVPVLALSQLSRASEQRGGERKPILSDLRDSGAIEQDADLVMFIHRPEMYEPLDKDGNSNEGKAELILAKHRNGPTGMLDLYFHKHFTRFASLSDREGPGEQ